MPAAWVPRGEVSSISAAWLPGLAGLMSFAGPCFEGWRLEGDGCSRLGGAVSHDRRSREVGGFHVIYLYIYICMCIYIYISVYQSCHQIDLDRRV